MTTRLQRNPKFSVGSPWGSRIHPKTGKEKFHVGQDYPAEAGTPIPAEIAGEVIYSGFNGSFGNTVIVKHHTDGYSLYAHMQNSDLPRVGQPIWRGEIIGRVGNTGSMSDGNHLHYALIKSGFNPTRASGGPIGLQLGKKNTHDPKRYHVDPPYLNETLRAQEILPAPNTPGGVETNGSSSGSFADRFEDLNVWPPGWSVPAPLGGLPGLLAEYAGNQARSDSRSASASGARAVPFVPVNPPVADVIRTTFQARDTHPPVIIPAAPTVRQVLG